jgi:hypothetical protein
MKLIFDGDSWTFGCEIADPVLAAQHPRGTHPGVYDFKEANDYYRIPKIYPHYMAKQLDCDYVNLSWPADDNRTIIERTMSYISTEYLSCNKSTDDIFVIIGWTSPERNSFWWKNGNFSNKFRLWPQVQNFGDKKQKKLWKMYVQHMWNPEEYIPRHVSAITQFQNFCNAHNIKWLSYNAFYQTPHQGPDGWQDLDIIEELKSIDYNVGGYSYSDNGKRTSKKMVFRTLWDTVDPVRFYKKDQPNSTFKSFIEANVDDPLVGWHPSPSGHEAWATELVRYIKENNLL